VLIMMAFHILCCFLLANDMRKVNLPHL
jgi:hypothetical protein